MPQLAYRSQGTLLSHLLLARLQGRQARARGLRGAMIGSGRDAGARSGGGPADAPEAAAAIAAASGGGGGGGSWSIRRMAVDCGGSLGHFR